MSTHGRFYDVTSQDVQTGIARFQVRSFAVGATYQIDDDATKFPLEVLGEAYEGPFHKLKINGQATLRCWPTTSAGRPLPTAGGGTSGSGGASSSFVSFGGTPGSATKADVVNAGLAATPLLLLNASRKLLAVQNQSTSVVLIGTDPLMGVGGAGSKVVAVLAACGAAYDGTGGTFSCSDYVGPLYARAVGVPGDVSVLEVGTLAPT